MAWRQSLGYGLIARSRLHSHPWAGLPALCPPSAPFLFACLPASPHSPALQAYWSLLGGPHSTAGSALLSTLTQDILHWHKRALRHFCDSTGPIQTTCVSPGHWWDCALRDTDEANRAATSSNTAILLEPCRHQYATLVWILSPFALMLLADTKDGYTVFSFWLLIYSGFKNLVTDFFWSSSLHL